MGGNSLLKYQTGNESPLKFLGTFRINLEILSPKVEILQFVIVYLTITNQMVIKCCECQSVSKIRLTSTTVLIYLTKRPRIDYVDNFLAPNFLNSEILF